jgi:hypothetical protein
LAPIDRAARSKAKPEVFYLLTDQLGRIDISSAEAYHLTHIIIVQEHDHLLMNNPLLAAS